MPRLVFKWVYRIFAFIHWKFKVFHVFMVSRHETFFLLFTLSFVTAHGKNLLFRGMLLHSKRLPLPEWWYSSQFPYNQFTSFEPISHSVLTTNNHFHVIDYAVWTNRKHRLMQKIIFDRSIKIRKINSWWTRVILGLWIISSHCVNEKLTVQSSFNVNQQTSVAPFE